MEPTTIYLTVLSEEHGLECGWDTFTAPRKGELVQTCEFDEDACRVTDLSLWTVDQVIHQQPEPGATGRVGSSRHVVVHVSPHSPLS